MGRAEARAIRVGIRPIPVDPTDATVPARMVALARAAEAAGLGIVAIPERLGAGGVPAALPVCAAIAAATSQIAIATALLPLSLHHPLRVAEDAATIDGLAAGRFELGIGLGADRDALAGFGLDAGLRGERFDESLALLRAAWKTGPIDHQGQHFNIDGTEVFPKPARKGGPPIWVGARSGAALQRAAEQDVGVLVEPATAFGPYRRACGAAGHLPRIALTGCVAEIEPRIEDWLREEAGSLDLWVEVDPHAADALAPAIRLAHGLG